MIREVMETGSSVRGDVDDPAALRAALRIESRRSGLTGTRTLQTGDRSVAAYNEAIGYQVRRRTRAQVDPTPGSALDALFGGRPQVAIASRRRTVIRWPGRR